MFGLMCRHDIDWGCLGQIEATVEPNGRHRQASASSRGPYPISSREFDMSQKRHLLLDTP